MYNFKAGGNAARIEGAMIVGLAWLIHILLVFTVIKVTIPNFYQNTVASLLPKNKAFGYLVILLLVIGAYLWYNKSRIKKIVSKRGDIPEYVENSWDILFVVLLLVVPIIPIIIIFWKG